jgi:hypothetical protein
MEDGFSSLSKVCEERRTTGHGWFCLVPHHTFEVREIRLNSLCQVGVFCRLQFCSSFSDGWLSDNIKRAD